MSKSRFWKAARTLVLCTTVLVGGANIAWNMYLLDTRPTVSAVVPDADHLPKNWLCGKSDHGFGPVHCVLLSERDRTYNLWMQASFLAVIPFFFALGFWAQSRRQQS